MARHFRGRARIISRVSVSSALQSIPGSSVEHTEKEENLVEISTPGKTLSYQGVLVEITHGGLALRSRNREY